MFTFCENHPYVTFNVHVLCQNIYNLATWQWDYSHLWWGCSCRNSLRHASSHVGSNIKSFTHSGAIPISDGGLKIFSDSCWQLFQFPFLHWNNHGGRIENKHLPKIKHDNITFFSIIMLFSPIFLQSPNISILWKVMTSSLLSTIRKICQIKNCDIIFLPSLIFTWLFQNSLSLIKIASEMKGTLLIMEWLHLPSRGIMPHSTVNYAYIIKV